MESSVRSLGGAGLLLSNGRIHAGNLPSKSRGEVPIAAFDLRDHCLIKPVLMGRLLRGAVR